MNYDEYVALFNTGDDAALVERFFCDDLVFSSGARAYQGKQELLKFLAWAHDGVREVIRPQTVLRDQEVIFAEVDMDFHATMERPEFPFGHLHPGDLVTVKFFVTSGIGRTIGSASLPSLTLKLSVAFGGESFLAFSKRSPGSLKRTSRMALVAPRSAGTMANVAPSSR